MKKIIAVIGFLATVVTSYSQYRGNNWAIPDSTGINFNTFPPTLLETNLSANNYGIAKWFPVGNTSSISNENGQLLFYFDGENIWGRDNYIIQNGEDITSQNILSNGCVFLPFPKNDSIYYFITLFSVPGDQRSGVNYSIINKNLNNGFGGIIEGAKNILLYPSDSVSDQLTAVRHANGRDWWILVKQSSQFDYAKFILNPEGLQYQGTQDAGHKISRYGERGTARFNPQGNQLATMLCQSYLLEILDFDRCTGNLSNLKEISTKDTLPNGPGGVCYSPNGKILYYTAKEDTIYQIVGIDGSMPISKQAIGSQPYLEPNLNGMCFSYMQLAPDGKIYITLPKCYYPDSTYEVPNIYLTTIDSPDVEGPGCHLSLNSFYLGGKRTSLGLPNMPNYNLGRMIGSQCDTITEVKSIVSNPEQIEVSPNPSNGIFSLNYKLNKGALLKVYNSIGQEIYKEELDRSKNQTDIDLSEQPGGIYILYIKSNTDKLYRHKLIIYKK